MAEGATATPEGIDSAGVEAWFARHVPEAELPLRFERVSGGRSNLTYSVRDAGARRWDPGWDPPTT
jgi:aminoglycoside phosphotransferase (APT) family kinase protein